MPMKSSIALVTGAFMFLAFWGIGLSTIETNSSNSYVTAEGYGVFVPAAVEIR